MPNKLAVLDKPTPALSDKQGWGFTPSPLSPCLTNGKRLLSPRQAQASKAPVFAVKVGFPAHVGLALLDGMALTDEQERGMDWQVSITPLNLPGDKRKALRHLLSLIGALPGCTCPECRAEP